MKFITKFSIGDRVRVKKGSAFTVAHIRIQALSDTMVLIEYRPEYLTGRSGPWTNEKYLELATRP